MTGWDLLKTLRRYAVSIVALALVGALVALGYALKDKGNGTEYLARASTNITLNTQSIPVDTSDPDAAKAYLEVERGVEAPLYSSDSVLEQAIETTGVNLEVQELSKNVVVVTPKSPKFSLETIIYVKQENEEDAVALADAIVEAGVQTINEEHKDGSVYTTVISQTARADAVDSGFSMSTLEENNGQNVKIAVSSVSPKKKLVVGFALGLLLGIGQAVLRWLLDKRVRNFDDLKEITDSPVIGATAQDATSTTLQSHSTVKFLRSSLLAENRDAKRTVVITSARATNDTSNISQALAESLRSSGQKALLIDVQNASKVNIQQVNPDNWQQQADAAEYFWGTETDVSNTADFLASRSCAQLLDTIMEADIVPIANAPGVLDNAAALMPMSNTRTVIVASSGKTTSTDIRDCEKVLDSVGKQIDDVIMGDVPQSLTWKLRYGYETAQSAA